MSDFRRKLRSIEVKLTNIFFKLIKIKKKINFILFSKTTREDKYFSSYPLNFIFQLERVDAKKQKRILYGFFFFYWFRILQLLHCPVNCPLSLGCFNIWVQATRIAPRARSVNLPASLTWPWRRLSLSHPPHCFLFVITPVWCEMKATVMWLIGPAFIIHSVTALTAQGLIVM